MAEMLKTKGTTANKRFMSYINGVCCLHGIDALTNHDRVDIHLELCIKEAEHYFCKTFMFNLQSEDSVWYGEWLAKFKSPSSQLMVLISDIAFYDQVKGQPHYQHLLHQCDQIIYMQSELLLTKGTNSEDSVGDKFIENGDWHIFIHDQQDHFINRRIKKLQQIPTVDIREIII